MLGGGQLGRYFVMSAHRLGYKVIVLDPDPVSIAGAAADEQIVAAYDDADALRDLASRLRRHHLRVRERAGGLPGPAGAVQTGAPGSERGARLPGSPGREGFLTRAGVPVAPNLTCCRASRCPPAQRPLPRHPQDRPRGLRRRGQWTIHQADELPGAPGRQRRALRAGEAAAAGGEFALTLARSPSGAISALPLVQNWHSGGILDRRPAPRPMCPPWRPRPSASPSTSSPPSIMWAC